MKVLSRTVLRYTKDPLSIRSAMRVIVFATLVTILASGVAMWLTERSTFSNVGLGFWWALQTVTTVGYGDLIPTSVLGRIVGGLVMLESIAFLSVITAALTSSFVERARAERHAMMPEKPSQSAAPDELGARLADIASRLERIEAALPPARGDKGNPDLSVG